MTPQLTISETVIPEEIAKAIFKTTKELGALGKSEENPFQKYSYVPIDKYYELVATKAISNGLTWYFKEIEANVRGSGEKPIIEYKFMFTLMHENGGCVPSFDVITVFHPWQGAQTLGSAASYADKAFMRKTFKVVTGEKDADATVDTDQPFESVGVKDTANLQQNDSKNSLKKDPPIKDNKTKGLSLTVNQEKSEKLHLSGEPQTDTEESGLALEGDLSTVKSTRGDLPILQGVDGDWSIVYTFFEQFIDKLETVKELKDWWNMNDQVLSDLKENDREAYDKTLLLFNDTRAKLPKE